LPDERLADARRGLKALRDQVDAEPKSTRWRIRARVGDRVRWCEEPDEK
jgi:hypothetical protein